jgi:hypothetical protein
MGLLVVTAFQFLGWTVWQIKPVVATQTFYSGWENSGGSDATDGGKWNVGTGSVESSIKYTGSYGLNCSKDKGASNYSVAGSTEFYAQFAVQFDTSVDTSRNIPIVYTYDASWGNQFIMGVKAGGGGLDGWFVGGVSVSATVSLDVWYDVQFMRKADPPNNGGVKLWINGSLLISSANQTYANNVGVFQLINGENGDCNWFFDDVSFGDSQLPPITPFFTTVTFGSTVSYNATRAGNTSLLSISCDDGVALDGYKFCSNVTGSMVNSSFTPFSGSPSSVVINSTVLMPSVGNHIQVQWFANDTNHVWGASAIFTLTSYVSSGNLTVEGNKVHTTDGDTIVLKGMDYTYFVNAANPWDGTWTKADGTITNTWSLEGINDTLNFMQASNCTLVRVLMTVKYWLENTSGFQNHVEYIINQSASHGIYTDLTFWNTNATNAEPQGFLPWEDSNNVINNTADFINLWGNLTTILKDYPSVIFELWNEPNTYPSWFSVAQQCIDRIRSVGATQPIIIQFGYEIDRDLSTSWTVGMDWAFSYPLNDPLGNLIYSAHIYNYAWAGFYEASTYADIDTCLSDCLVYDVATVHPVVIGEIGYNLYDGNSTLQSEYYNNTLTLLDEHDIGYLAWASPPWSSAMQWGLIQYTVANYSLNSAGVILVEHTGGMNYSVWLEGSGIVTLTVTNPQNTTYTTPTVPVQLSASGGTIDKIWWNCKNVSTWIYGSNQTYTTPTSMTGFVNGTSYTFYGWANNTLGNWDEETVMFTVQITAPVIIITYPTNTTYTVSVIPVSFEASSGYPVDKKWFNVKNVTDWVYAANQTYTIPVNVTGFVNGTSYTFYCWANNTYGLTGESTVMFTVELATISRYYFNLNFLDLDALNVEPNITWQLYNSTQLLTYAEGQSTLMAGTFTLKTYYHANLILTTSYATSVFGNTTVYVYPQMKAWAYGYLAFSNTVDSLVLNNQSAYNLTFTFSGTSPNNLTIDYPYTPTYLALNGVNQTTYTYAGGYITRGAPSLGTWNIIYAPYVPPVVPPASLDVPYLPTLQFLWAGDFFGFILAAYTGAFGSVDIFFGVVAMLIVMPIYIRTKSLPFLSIAWILLGSVFLVAMPLVSGMAVLFLVLGIGSLLYQLFMKTRD